MSKINNKSIRNGLQILGIFAVAVLLLPSPVKAASYGTNTNYYTGDYFGNNSVQSNPTPSISSISPSYANAGSGGKTITITGSGFVPTSIARVNGTDRYTTFIDYSHLFIQLNAGDMNLGSGFYITVFNGGPGGGYSNSSFFTLNKAVAYNPAPVYNNNAPQYYGAQQPAYNNPAPQYNNAAPQYNNTYDYNAPAPMTSPSDVNPNQPNQTPGSALASNVIYGSNSFLPSGIVQWILFAILILLIVILARRMFGATERYHATPLKHD